ncbi:MAG TPA: hypothetical protein VHQ47_07855 [Phycisphaerae bacterium]|nr:hypothetical protein [Phycisphaerae bacterium]
MTRHLLASLLSAAVLASTAAAFAQNNTSPSGASPMTTGAVNSNAPTIQGGNVNNAPAKNSPPGGLVVKMNGVTTANGQTQIQGRLVDLYSLAHGDLPAPTGPQAMDSGGSAAAAGMTPNDLPHNTGTGAINGKGTGMSGSTGTLVPLNGPNTNGNNSGTSVGIAPGGTNSSFGTYNHPGATGGVGTSALQSGVIGQGISPNGPIAIRQGMTPADDATGTGTASLAGGGSGKPNTLAPGSSPTPANNTALPAAAPATGVATDAAIRQHLNDGVPAAIVANGHAYTLACDPKQLAQYAGQTVRVSGTISQNNTLLPNSLDVQSSSGQFQPVALTPLNNNTRSASER